MCLSVTTSYIHCNCRADVLCPQENKNVCQEYNWTESTHSIIIVLQYCYSIVNHRIMLLVLC